PLTATLFPYTTLFRSCGVGLLLDRGKEASPDACLAPAVEPAGNGGPAAISLGQITPRGTGTEEPQDAVQDASVVSGWAASMRFLDRKSTRLNSSHQII